METPFAIFEVFESKNADVSYTNEYQNKVTCRYDWKLHAFMKNIVNKSQGANAVNKFHKNYWKELDIVTKY